MIDYFSTGNAYFDAETGLLLYHHAVWVDEPDTANKMFYEQRIWNRMRSMV